MGPYDREITETRRAMDAIHQAQYQIGRREQIAHERTLLEARLERCAAEIAEQSSAIAAGPRPGQRGEALQALVDRRDRDAAALRALLAEEDAIAARMVSLASAINTARSQIRAVHERLTRRAAAGDEAARQALARLDWRAAGIAPA